MIETDPSAVARVFLECLTEMRATPTLWMILGREFSENVDRAATAISANMDRSTIQIKLTTVAAIIAAMHKSAMDAREKRFVIRGNKEARKVATDALIRLDSFARTYYKVRVINEHRLEFMAEQDRVDRGGRIGRRSLIAALVSTQASV